LTQTGTLDSDARQRFADEVTAIHVSETGAPIEFVNVIFPELPEGRAFRAGKVADKAIIQAWIRAGRTDEVRHNIIQRVSDAYLELTGTDPMHVLVVVEDAPSSHIMEGGQIAPEPNPEAEKAWFAKQQTAGTPA
jgi:phenylpyruvate tautomerase PptA (4-oxalocrotonate tautomerase family)